MVKVRSLLIDRLAITALTIVVAVMWTQIGNFGAKVTDNQHQLAAQQKTIEQEQADIAQSAVTSCHIQSIGLLAQPFLVKTIGAINDLITLPLSAESKRQRALVPKWLRARQDKAVKALKDNSHTYVQAVNQQPAGRLCK